MTGTLHALLPHAGAMCLIDAIAMADDKRIACTAASHRDPANPLRHAGRLSVRAGIEYAAQAVAAHGSLLARRAGTGDQPRGGMIAVLTGISWHVDYLDDIDDDLLVTAEKLADLPDGLCYRFAVAAADTMLLAGELIVALQAQGTAA